MKNDDILKVVEILKNGRALISYNADGIEHNLFIKIVGVEIEEDEFEVSLKSIDSNGEVLEYILGSFSENGRQKIIEEKMDKIILSINSIHHKTIDNFDVVEIMEIKEGK